MKIIVTGAKGQLGSQLINIIKKRYFEIGKIEVIASDIDISNKNEVLNYINEIKPDIIINCAAYTNVNACEENIELAFKVNSLGPRNISIAAEKVGAKLIHISTDYVFPGDSKVPYKEYDIPSPINVYGNTKLMGEKYVESFCSRYFIIRTSWLYGYNGDNFVKTIMQIAKQKGELKVVDDQVGNPTNVEDLSYHILKIALTEEYGIYHCTGNGMCSWYEFACNILKLSGINCIITPINSDDTYKLAKRPSFSCLDNMMLRCTVGDEMRIWQEALEEFISNVKLEV